MLAVRSSTNAQPSSSEKIARGSMFISRLNIGELIGQVPSTALTTNHEGASSLLHEPPSHRDGSARQGLWDKWAIGLVANVEATVSDWSVFSLIQDAAIRPDSLD